MPPRRRRLTGAGGGVSSAVAKFSPAEIRKLEKLVGDTRDDVLDERLHQTLADEFNAVRDRRSKELTAEGLRRWFVRRIGEPEGSDTVAIRDRSGVAGAHLTLAEIQKLEILVADTRDDLLDERFHQKLADGFNAVRDRRFMELTAESLRGWFVRRIGEPKGLDTVMDSVPSGDVRDAGLPKALDAVMDSAPSEDVRDAGLPKGLDTVMDSAPSGDVRDAGLPKSSPQSSSETTKGEKIPHVAVWEFEARSSNGAWYDVDTFVSHRNINGNLEACVRYQGFGSEDDEWVIVKDAVRLRSISLESSECLRVGVGDLVVCFRETSTVSAAHYDAHVLEIERKLHDIRGCRCQFLIRYINDQTEEKVPLRRLCVRPPPDVNFFRDAVSFFVN